MANPKSADSMMKTTAHAPINGLEKVSEDRFGPMEVSIMDIGTMMLRMATESSLMLMALCMWVIGRTDARMEKVSKLGLMAASTSATGRMT